MPNLRSGLLAGLAVALCLPLGAVAQDKPETKIDPKVKEAFDQAYKAYQGLTGLHEKIAVTASGSMEVFRQSVLDSLEIRYQKPNKLWAQQTEKQKDGTLTRQLIVSDGITVWRWDGTTNTYTKKKAGATFKALGDLPNGTPETDALFLEKNPLENLGTNLPSIPVKMGQPTKVGDMDVDVVELTIQGPNVAASYSLKFLIGQKDHLFHGLLFGGSNKDEAGKDLRVDLKMDYTVVNTAPTFTAADFTFTPPPGAKLAGATPPSGTVPKPPVKTPPAKGEKNGSKK
jgi:outer membrane lipoprotein-sorting protein